MSEMIDIKEPWGFRQLQCEDHRGMGYVSNADGVDILHTGAAELWQAENIAIGKLAAAAPELLEALIALVEFDPSIHHKEGPARYAKAREAISKATA